METTKIPKREKEDVMKKNRLVAVALLVIFAIILLPACSFAGGAVEPLKQAERPVWNVGDTWIYQVVADGKKLTMKMVVAKSDEKGYTVAVDRGGEKKTEFYNRNLNFVRAEDEKGWMMESCEPQLPSFKWPLKPGQWWSGTYFFQNNQGSGYPMNFSTEVAGPATLINVAGQEVATMKLVFKRTNQYNRFPSNRETWYDPLTKFVMKRVDESSRGKEIRELISFTPGEVK